MAKTKVKKKPRRKKPRPVTSSTCGLSEKELDVAAHYFCISNMAEEPRKMTVSCIYSTFYNLECNLQAETEWMDEGPGNLDGEVADWMKDLRKGVGVYAYDEWMKMRDGIEGIDSL